MLYVVVKFLYQLFHNQPNAITFYADDILRWNVISASVLRFRSVNSLNDTYIIYMDIVSSISNTAMSCSYNLFKRSAFKLVNILYCH